MNNLEINIENQNGEIVLSCTGRLDANSAGHLNDYINKLVREGHYQISLNMDGIEYLSSAGIRSLVSQHKNLTSVNGCFCIKSMSHSVFQILNMVGMVNMLSQVPQKTESVSAKEETKNQFETTDFIFKLTSLNSDGKTAVNFYGEPELAQQSGFTASNARLVKSGDNHFAIGLGAIGDSFEECKKRFGEYLLLGKNVAYLPADGSKKPDYMVSSGQLIAELTELYGLHFDGNFSLLVRFEQKTDKATIGLSQLAEEIKKITKFNQWAFVFLAESGGLIGTSLNASPVDGKKIFTFPEVKNTINFTTESAYHKMLTLSVGFISSEKDEQRERFLRPLKPDSSTLGHVHTAVFPYIPLKKTEIDLNETIDYLFDNTELTDILHLTNDSREIVGIGESQFVQGFCWIVPVESTINISNQ